MNHHTQPTSQTASRATRITHHVSRFTHYVSRLTPYALRFTLYALLLSACAAPTLSGQPLADANRLYEAGQYHDAIAAYTALVNTGVADGTLYYNLGNAYFKIGEVGHAILNYRRAERLLPRDRDIAANLQLARAQAQDRLEADGGNDVGEWLSHLLVGWTTLNEMAALALGLWLILCAIIIVALLWPRGRRRLRYPGAAIAIVLALSSLSLGLRLWDMRHPAAVIVASSVEVHSGPGSDYLTEFTLHAGTEVRVIENRAGWTRIQLPGDLQGWAPETTLDLVEVKP